MFPKSPMMGCSWLSGENIPEDAHVPHPAPGLCPGSSLFLASCQCPPWKAACAGSSPWVPDCCKREKPGFSPEFLPLIPLSSAWLCIWGVNQLMISSDRFQSLFLSKEESVFKKPVTGACVLLVPSSSCAHSAIQPGLEFMHKRQLSEGWILKVQVLAFTSA